MSEFVRRDVRRLTDSVLYRERRSHLIVARVLAFIAGALCVGLTCWRYL